LSLKNIISAKEARANFAALLDDAEQGRSHVIIRNSRIAAGIVSPEQVTLLPMLEAVLHEIGESLAMAADPAVVAAVRAAEEEAAIGHIVSYTVRSSVSVSAPALFLECRRKKCRASSRILFQL
jgi:antitoxin (DNA-binding transcriptional repressor) of toxin-antitoxin stability system